MIIEIAKFSGYCYGVKRALNITEKALEKYGKKKKKVYTLGSIIHNPGVVKKLSTRGLISVNNIEDVEDGSIFIIRSHGMSSILLNLLKKKKDIYIIDATCPFVKNAQMRAVELSEMGFFVVVIGNKEHPEVCSIKDNVNPERITVIENSKDIMDSVYNKKKIGVVVQTTQKIDRLKDITGKLLDFSEELYIVNTICDTTKKRQESVRKLSKKVDVMLVIGGKNSANTTHLADISRENNRYTYHIESSSDMDPGWFGKDNKIGICGGASTPENDILDVKKKIELINTLS
jgi:(E)-4-hydroxy-3-methyl-but-2-enyl pyrophosphate reductase